METLTVVDIFFLAVLFPLVLMPAYWFALWVITKYPKFRVLSLFKKNE